MACHVAGTKKIEDWHVWPWALSCLSPTCQAHLFLWHLRRRSKFRGRSCAMAGCRGVSWFRTSGWRRPSFRRSNVGVSDTVTIYLVHPRSRLMEVIFWRVGHNMLLNKTGFLPNKLTLAFCGLEDVGLADAGFLFQGILHADRKIQKRVWPREANSSAKYNIASGLVRVWARSFEKYAGQHLPLSFLCYNCLLPPHTAAPLHLNSTMPRTFVAYTSHHVARIIKPRCSEKIWKQNKQD